MGVGLTAVSRQVFTKPANTCPVNELSVSTPRSPSGKFQRQRRDIPCDEGRSRNHRSEEAGGGPARGTARTKIGDQNDRRSVHVKERQRQTGKASFRQSLLLGGLPVRRRRLVVNHCCKWRGPPKPRRSRPATGFLKPTLCTHLRARTTFDQTIRLGSRDCQNGITAARGSRVVCSFDEPR